jgi:DNA invertase Pin-like site-specific DNA recombinase
MQNETMIYGYARVSTAAQDETGQVRQLKAAGCEKVFREKITGTTAARPQLSKLIKKACSRRRGDNPGH